LIPKIIHYCWFGELDIPVDQLAYINEWKAMHPDWEFVFWNEANSPLHLPYLKEASRLGKWSNVSNLIRFYSIMEQGGIYLDTDIKLIKNLTSLLENDCFFGFEEGDTTTNVFWVNSAIYGSAKNNKFIGECFEELLTRFDGTEESNLSGPHLLTEKLIRDKGLTSYHEQVLDGIHLYPVEYFYPIHFSEAFKVSELEKNIFPQTIAVHVWARSWIDKSVLIDSVDHLTYKTVIQQKYIDELKKRIEEQEAKAAEIYFWKQHFEKEFNRIKDGEDANLRTDILLLIKEIESKLDIGLNDISTQVNGYNSAISLSNEKQWQLRDTFAVHLNEMINSAIVKLQSNESSLMDIQSHLNMQGTAIKQMSGQLNVFFADFGNSIKDLKNVCNQGDELTKIYFSKIEHLLLEKTASMSDSFQEAKIHQQALNEQQHEIKSILSINQFQQVQIENERRAFETLNKKYIHNLEEQQKWQLEKAELVKEKFQLVRQQAEEIANLKAVINGLKMSTFLVNKITGKKILR
jgi:anion-transporting  ArsA/GET3 family ATPase